VDEKLNFEMTLVNHGAHSLLLLTRKFWFNERVHGYQEFEAHWSGGLQNKVLHLPKHHAQNICRR